MKRATERHDDAWLSRTPMPQNPSRTRGSIRLRLPNLEEQEGGVTGQEMASLTEYTQDYPW